MISSSVSRQFNESRGQSSLIFVLFPAIAMLLGWGLRGYIGGGPYGALIPGTFVALSLCLLLSYKVETAAVAALFGAIGTGYGGNMTYGQTLGFVRDPNTLYWGVLGCLVKGTVWGLLGGAVMGLGLVRTTFSRTTVIIAVLLTIPAFFLGVALINDPKLIYFSNRLDKPRDESWAGLLFAAITLLAFLRYRGSKEAVAIPLQFSLWGALGGGIGFGGGCLWLAFGPPEMKWVGWWKMMEFTFGLILGGSLGWCAWLYREKLQQSGQSTDTLPSNLVLCGLYIAWVIFVFFGVRTLVGLLPEAWATRTLISLISSYVIFAAVSLTLGLNSLQVAWQCAVTLTVFHTVLDYTRDLNDAANFGYTVSYSGQIGVLIITSLVVGLLTNYFANDRAAVRKLFLLVLWACYLSGCARSFLHQRVFSCGDDTGGLLSLLRDHPSLLLVHGIFTISTLWLTWIAATGFEDSKDTTTRRDSDELSVPR